MGIINNTNNRRHPAAATAAAHHHHHYTALLLLNQRRRRRRIVIYDHQCLLLFGILLSVLLCISFMSSNNYFHNSRSGMILYANANAEADTATDATTSSKTSELISACSNSENESSNGESSCTEQNQIVEDEEEQEHDQGQYDDQCIMDAKNGLCEKNPQEMFLRCPYECLEYSEQLGRMIYLPSLQFSQPGRIKQQQPEEVFCENKIDDTDCEEYVHEQECLKNPEYMLEHCAQSCWNCFLPTSDSNSDTNLDSDSDTDFDRTERKGEVVAVDIGLKQTLDYLPNTVNNQQKRDEQTTLFLKTLQETTNYMSRVVLNKSNYVGVRRLCRNYQSSCTQSVVALFTQHGQTCHNNTQEPTLKFTCGPACQSCHEMILSQDELKILYECLPDPSTNIFINDDDNDDNDDDDEDDDEDDGNDNDDDDEKDEDNTKSPEKATLDTMFRRIVGEIPYPKEYASKVPTFDAKIISRPSVNPLTHHDRPYWDLDFVVGGPWIVVLDHFLTEEECIHLIEVGDQLGREASTIEDDAEEDDDEYDDDDDDDEYDTEEEDGQHRNSLTAWCDDDICDKDPIVQRVQQKIGFTTGVLDPNYFEPFQLLKYRAGQYYKEHHDENSSFHAEKYSIDGPRILTFFLYLNEETDDNAIDHETNNRENNESSTGPSGTMMGGETRFTNILGDDSNLHVDIKPKRGRALLWPSMMNADLYEHEIRTYHEARVVHPGYIKYGANVWLHLREHRNTRHTCNETALAPIQDKLEHIPDP